MHLSKLPNKKSGLLNMPAIFGGIFSFCLGFNLKTSIRRPHFSPKREPSLSTVIKIILVSSNIPFSLLTLSVSIFSRWWSMNTSFWYWNPSALTFPFGTEISTFDLTYCFVIQEFSELWGRTRSLLNEIENSLPRHVHDPNG